MNDAERLAQIRKYTEEGNDQNDRSFLLRLLGEAQTAIKQFPGLSHFQLKQACTNVGVDLDCDACCAIFYTGAALVEEHQCKSPIPPPLWGVWCVEDRGWCGGTIGTEAHARAALPRWQSGEGAAVDPAHFHYEIGRFAGFDFAPVLRATAPTRVPCRAPEEHDWLKRLKDGVRGIMTEARDGFHAVQNSSPATQALFRIIAICSQLRGDE